jgi:hypothetical protein
MNDRLLMPSELIAEKKILSGTYGAVRFSKDSQNRLQKYIEENNIPNPCDTKDLHSTFLYSRKKVNFPSNGVFDEQIRVNPKTYKLDLFGEKKNCLVLRFESKYLQSRWKAAMDLGATYDYPALDPHVTLSYDVGEDFDLSKLQLPTFFLAMSEEYTEELDG